MLSSSKYENNGGYHLEIVVNLSELINFFPSENIFLILPL